LEVTCAQNRYPNEANSAFDFRENLSIRQFAIKSGTFGSDLNEVDLNPPAGGIMRKVLDIMQPITAPRLSRIPAPWV